MVVLPLKDYNPLRRIDRQWASIGLIALNIAIFMAEAHWRQGDVWPQKYGLIPAAAQALPLHDLASVSTAFSSMFLHDGWLHLLGNMLFLWVFGDNVEDALGHGRFLAFYLLCGAIAGFSQIVSDPDSTIPMIGASGAVSGVMGAYALLYPRARVLTIFFRIPWKMPAWAVVGIWGGWQVYQLFYAGPDQNVAWWAHMGGFVAGMVLVVPFKQRGVALFAPPEPE